MPLLLHCLTLPCGADVFWHLLEQEFTNDCWKRRFSAVEKVANLGRHLKSDFVKSNQPVLTSLAHAFCNLIGSLDDVNPAVAQRTILYLETINSKALKVGFSFLRSILDFSVLKVLLCLTVGSSSFLARSKIFCSGEMRVSFLMGQKIVLQKCQLLQIFRKWSRCLPFKQKVISIFVEEFLAQMITFIKRFRL